MALKEFNFKQFLLQRGEWVGLGLALAVALPLFGLGMMKILSSPSPMSNALALEQLAKSADGRITSARPPDDADKAPKEFFTNITYTRVDPEAYSTPTDWFVSSSLEDLRRRSPEILPPAELRVDYVLGCMKGHIISRDGKRVQVIKDKAAIVIRDKKSKKNIKITPEKLSGAGRYGGYGRGMPGGASYGPGGGGQGTGGLSIPSSSWADIDKVGNNPEERLAEQIYPLRMVMVTGTFPYRQQIEEFRRALKKRSLDEFFAMINSEEASWKFKNFAIQRRVLYPDGREQTPWQDYDKVINGAFAELFMRAVEYDRDDTELYKYEGILSPGLAMVRPQLERGQYPKIEFPSIKDTIAKLDKLSQGDDVKRPLSDLSRKLQKKGVDIWDPFNPLLPEEAEEPNKPMADKPAQPSDSSEKKTEKKDTDAESELLIPDKALVRFFDVTVEPGFIYEYRIKVKMANPNYNQKNVAYQKLREMTEIEAREWTVLPRVEVPYDVAYYVMDEKPHRDEVTLQIHRWIKYLMKDPQDEKTSTPLGDWTIADKLPALRGEYIGRITDVKIPLWNVEKEDFELGVNPKTKQRKIPVDFTVRTGNALDPALLIDYQGGKDIQDRLEYRVESKPKSSLVTDSVPVQILVLTPEGKLVVRSYPEDNANEERAARYKAWKDWIAEVESGKRKMKPDEPLFDRFRGGGNNN